MSKELGRETTDKIANEFKEVKAIGEDVTEQAEEVDSIIDGIDTSNLDSDDMGAIDTLKGADHEVFVSEIKEQVEEPTSEIAGEAGTHISDMTGKKASADAAGAKMREAQSASEIGAANAEVGAEHMTESSGVYESLANETQEDMNEGNDAAASFRDRVGGLF
jgi:hypothetical protein